MVALQLIERAFAAAHGYATLWRSGLYTDRQATAQDVASEAAAVARALAAVARTPAAAEPSHLTSGP